MWSPILVATGVLLLGCDSKPPTGARDRPAAGATKIDTRPTAPLVDLTANSTLAPVRAAFNARKGEIRFLTLLSPT
jgi:hypothetical protein